MKNKIILDDNFIPPVQVSRDKYYLEVLGEKHNKLDYEAWTSSLESLKGIFGPRNKWPEEVSGLDQNLKDLINHYDEFQNREAYTYSILNDDGRKCIGCLYIRPSQVPGYSAKIDFWFRDDSEEFEAEFYEWLKDWLVKDWNLTNCLFPGRSMSWDDYYKEYDQHQ